MSALGLKIIDESVQAANSWINDLDDLTGWDHKQRSYRLLRAVIHVIRDHLNVDEAAQFGAQLPVLVRGIYYEGWNPSKTPVTERSRDGFIDRVQAAFRTDPMGDAPEAIAAVMTLLDARISAGEMEDVRGTFTRQIRTLFPDA
ncbi:MAG: hypothetical protein CL814_11475 [Confluentimicrobium sp.]|jgi:uncharacterized protein (DUF2267 family)|uniref:DUF2267 domain-containing protein n=1 Tax=Actibacterium sp. TaxID=1872125 RepID=UPI000C4D528C|nr:DUF2267 domain-containing protein [Actibacterium sp.]MBC57539.1 hypothetical protein [Actibacterium sp.]MDY6860361.1 DUF2267 domain-containing protein [Pseudomonadota bacterium]|tara:strand:+ start:1466 stop:1897 length:432 start_codon:yes stop_codon:yes gene_type:complete